MVYIDVDGTWWAYELRTTLWVVLEYDVHIECDINSYNRAVYRSDIL